MNRPLWFSADSRPALPQLTSDTSADVCVVGAGVAGLTTAYTLLQEGRSVVVVDGGDLGVGETARTTAHLVTALDFGWHDLVRIHGAPRATIAAQSHRAAIERIGQIVAEEDIDCAFAHVDGFLVDVSGSPTKLDQELLAAHAAGLTDVEMIPRVAFGNPARPGLRYPRQAQLHPFRYLAGLARAVTRRGGHIFELTRAVRIDTRSGGEVVMADGTRVTAPTVVLATNVPFEFGAALVPKVAAYRSYVIAVRIPRDTVEHALFWDTDEPFHYVRGHRPRSGTHDLLIVGGEDHRTGQDDEGPRIRFRRLLEWARTRWDGVGDVEFCWSGQIQQSADGLAVIGRVHDTPRAYVITGDSGNGMTHGTIAAQLVADDLAGRHNERAEVYAPHRMRVASLPNMLRENSNTASQLAAWVTPGEDCSVDRLSPGCGMVVRRGLTKVAVYRDPTGELVELSAVCPHLYCVVAWNPTEASWDCPCHGSRFDPRGRVLNGPTNQPLERAVAGNS